MRPRYRFFLLLQIGVFVLSALLCAAAGVFRAELPWLAYGVWGVLGAFNLLYMWIYVPLLWRFSSYRLEDGKTLVTERGIIFRRIQRIDIKSIQYVTAVRLPFTKNAMLSQLHTIGGVVIIFR